MYIDDKCNVFDYCDPANNEGVDVCKNGGSCSLTENGAMCTCVGYFEGDQCETAGKCLENCLSCSVIYKYFYYFSTKKNIFM